jgi:sigma-B regulation protein RsbU (phosphoserine phosphatase)
MRTVDYAGQCLPAREVGGDYYDFVPLADGRLAMAVGDVSGKGVPAALLMSHVRASLHSKVHGADGPGSVVSAMDALLFSATESGRYATFFLAILSPATGEVQFCNAGHCPAFLVHDGKTELLAATGVPIGMFDGSKYVEKRRELAPGDLLVIYSDGVTEAAWKHEFYGEERLLPLVARLAGEGRSAAEIGRAVIEAVREFTHGDLQGDDVTLVVARRTA